MRAPALAASDTIAVGTLKWYDTEQNFGTICMLKYYSLITTSFAWHTSVCAVTLRIPPEASRPGTVPV